MNQLRGRFGSLPPIDPVVVRYLGPAIAVLLFAIAGTRYISSLVRAIKGPTWHPGDDDLSKAGTSTEASGAGVAAGDKTYDVVIIGGGCCGCVLASRLSENPAVSVLLLEAGRAGTRELFSRAPAGFTKMFGTAVDWTHWTEPGAGVKGRKTRWPRGRMLGGSTSINAMIVHHTSPSDFDEWETLGNPGWNYASLKPYFTKSQTLVPNPAYPLKAHPSKGEARGTTGPVKIGYAWFNSLSDAFIGACGALTFRTDIERVSTATAYLTKDVIARPNLTVATGATVTRVLFSPASFGNEPKAVGVEFTHVERAYNAEKANPIYRATAKKQVVLAAGSLATPQILEVSGIGARDVLEKAGVPVLVELDGVGENLKDHSVVGFNYHAKKGVSCHYVADPLKGLPALIEWLRYKTGPLTSNVADTIAFVRSTDATLAKTSGVPKADIPDHGSGGVGPDIELLQLPLGLADHGQVNLAGDTDFYTVAAVCLRPQSKGSVHIKTASTLDRPIIDAKIFSHEDDVKAHIWGIKICQKIAKTEPLASLLVKPYNGPGVPAFPDAATHSDAQLADWVRGQAETLYHPVGTVKMGAKELGGCLDIHLRVHGVQSLRVCDASIFPEQISGHPTAPLIAIAERFADELKAELA
ncbi:hypothetical protein RQP46_009890 [Phenoliferia psychrophenolica]